jgi:hypothetical protein
MCPYILHKTGELLFSTFYMRYLHDPLCPFNVSVMSFILKSIRLNLYS